MTIKFAQSTGGFYNISIHGENIPADATDEASWAFSHAQLMQGQSEGKIISADAAGNPILITPAPPATPTESDIAKRQIAEIESSITDRRLREAMLSTTGKSWLSARDAEIAALRAKIV